MNAQEWLENNPDQGWTKAVWTKNEALAFANKFAAASHLGITDEAMEEFVTAAADDWNCVIPRQVQDRIRQLLASADKSGVEMGKVNRVDELEERLDWLLSLIRGMSGEKLAPGREYLMDSAIFKRAEKVTVEERHYEDGRIQRKIGDGEWEEVSNPFGRRVFDGWWASNIEHLTREEVERRYPKEKK